MAGSALLTDNQDVYRGMANASWCKGGIVKYKAFMLRPASQTYPLEQELSLGRTPQSAVDELKENFGIGALSVALVHALPHALQVRQDTRDVSKAAMHGLPLFSTDENERSAALAVAEDLAAIAVLVQS